MDTDLCFCAVPGREPLVPDRHRVVGRRLRPGRKVRLLHSPIQDGQVDEEGYWQGRRRRRLDTFPVLPVMKDIANKLCSHRSPLTSGLITVTVMFHHVWQIKPLLVNKVRRVRTLNTTTFMYAKHRYKISMATQPEFPFGCSALTGVASPSANHQFTRWLNE